MKSQKYLLAAAALSGLLTGAGRSLASTASFAPGQASARQASLQSSAGVKATSFADDTTKHDCKGTNACKGQGGCKGSDNGCKGKNSCKGHGGCKSAPDKTA